MGLHTKSSVQMARAGRAPLGLRMQQATAVDRDQDNGVGQASMRKDAESLMQPCPLTKYYPPSCLNSALICTLLLVHVARWYIQEGSERYDQKH